MAHQNRSLWNAQRRANRQPGRLCRILFAAVCFAAGCVTVSLCTAMVLRKRQTLLDDQREECLNCRELRPINPARFLRWLNRCPTTLLEAMSFRKLKVLSKRF